MHMEILISRRGFASASAVSALMNRLIGCIAVSMVGRVALKSLRSSALDLDPQLDLDGAVPMARRGHVVVRDVTPALEERVSAWHFI
jgi:hypothetical protein